MAHYLQILPQAELDQLVALYNTRRYTELESRARLLLGQYPGDGATWRLLGACLKMQGKDPLHAFQKSAQFLPDDASAHSNLGVALKNAGRPDEAVASYLRAIQLQPELADAHFNLGNVLKELGRFEDAAGSYRRAVAFRPDYANAHYNLGHALKGMGQFGEAANSYRRALELQPGFTEAHFYLGLVLHHTGQIGEAAASYRRALELDPALAEAHNNLGACLKELGWPDEAVAHCNMALQISPDNALAHNNLGLAFKEAGRLSEAIACYRRAVALDPRYTQAHSNLVYLLTFHPAYDERHILEETKQFAADIAKARAPAHIRARTNNGSDRRLRIGYVSPDFRDHCQSLFTLPLLANHDRAQFEIYCYADLARPDDVSARIESCADVWRLTQGKTDAQLADMIAADGIDILVDSTMHMAHGRPVMFAQKAAPVQVAWLAYPGTTGIPAMDYRITDPWLDPPELGDARYSETSIRLPDTFWCYDPMTVGLEPNDLPALAAGHVTFGCLNNFCKVSDDTLHRWGEVMARVPASRLILLAHAGSHRRRVYDLLGQCGVAAERIEFVAYQPRRKYLQTYHRIDLCLDTLPYNGHTTSIDSCWMGVPVVTQVGGTVVGRAGWSQLNNLGLTELAAFDERAFIDIATGLATDLPRLSQLRQTLRPRMEQSPLMDAKRYARAMESTYRQIWQSACNLSEG
jgi:protein O-GlcNAc transferase